MLAHAAAFSWRLLLVTGAIAVVAFVMAQLRMALLPVVAALFITSLLFPPVSWLAKRGSPALLATLSVMVTELLAIAGAALFGLVGAILAVPLTAAATSMGSYLKSLMRQDGPDADDSFEPASNTA
ncbi:MAG: hypothetical protein M3198_05775 [Actinomycetota bacterium]|nr:hypothetical protein [Actinomycetota bacterium]